MTTSEPNDDFAGEVIIVTGAGAGLGRQYATFLAARGASLVVNDIDGARAQDVVTQITSHGGSAVPAPGSIADPAVADMLVEVAVGEFGRLDCLVNNAGIGVAGRLTRMADDDIRKTFDVHLLGTMWATRAALRVMEPQRSGRVVITSSGVGAFGLSRTAVYAAAKAGLWGLARSLSLDTDGTDIKVNAIAPIADTGLSDGFYQRFPHLPRDRYPTNAVAPAVAYLCHRFCPLNGVLLCAGGGRVSRVATVTAKGDVSSASTVADVSRQIERITSIDDPIELDSALAEFLLLDDADG